jgi:NAD(P)-dependent dehydrogenase (short-subunit alcohol dehydrogenase family)
MVEALLDRGVSRVYAAARDAATLAPVRSLDRERVVPLEIDITREDQIRVAAAVAGDVTLLVNNAGILIAGPALEAGRGNLLEHLNTNFLGTYEMIRQFAPVLERTRGAILNVMSLQSMAGSMGLDGYSASKAAIYSLTQSLRPALAARGVQISGAYPGGIDTDMLRGLDAPKSSPLVVAHGILDGLEAGEREIFPDPVARLLGEIWLAEPRRYEQLFALTDELVGVLEDARRDGSLNLAAARPGQSQIIPPAAAAANVVAEKRSERNAS